MEYPAVTSRFFRNLYFAFAILFAVIAAFQAAAAQTLQDLFTLAQQTPFAQHRLTAISAQYDFLHTTGLLIQAASIGFCLASIGFLFFLRFACPKVNTSN